MGGLRLIWPWRMVPSVEGTLPQTHGIPDLDLILP